MTISRMGRRLPLLVAGKTSVRHISVQPFISLKNKFHSRELCQCLENANVPNVTIAQSTKNFIQPLPTQIYNDAITTVLTTDDCELYF